MASKISSSGVPKQYKNGSPIQYKNGVLIQYRTEYLYIIELCTVAIIFTENPEGFKRSFTSEQAAMN